MKEHWKEHLQIEMALFEPPRDEKSATPSKTSDKPKLTRVDAKSGKAVRGL